MGTASPEPSVPVWRRPGAFSTHDVPPCPVPASVVPDAEKLLAALVQRARPAGSSTLAPYPLTAGPQPAPLVRAMHAELQASWDEHQRMEARGVLAVKPGALGVIEAQRVRCGVVVGRGGVGKGWDVLGSPGVRASIARRPTPFSLSSSPTSPSTSSPILLTQHARQAAWHRFRAKLLGAGGSRELAPPLSHAPVLPAPLSPQALIQAHLASAEQHLNLHAASVPPSAGLPGASFRLRRLGGALSAPSRLDLVRSAVEPGLLRRLNPFLSDQACGTLHVAVLAWLQVGVGAVGCDGWV